MNRSELKSKYFKNETVHKYIRNRKTTVAIKLYKKERDITII